MIGPSTCHLVVGLLVVFAKAEHNNINDRRKIWLDGLAGVGDGFLTRSVKALTRSMHFLEPELGPEKHSGRTISSYGEEDWDKDWEKKMENGEDVQLYSDDDRILVKLLKEGPTENNKGLSSTDYKNEVQAACQQVNIPSQLFTWMEFWPKGEVVDVPRVDIDTISCDDHSFLNFINDNYKVVIRPIRQWPRQHEALDAAQRKKLSADVMDNRLLVRLLLGHRMTDLHNDGSLLETDVNDELEYVYKTSKDKTGKGLLGKVNPNESQEPLSLAEFKSRFAKEYELTLEPLAPSKAPVMDNRILVRLLLKGPSEGNQDLLQHTDLKAEVNAACNQGRIPSKAQEWMSLVQTIATPTTGDHALHHKNVVPKLSCDEGPNSFLEFLNENYRIVVREKVSSQAVPISVSSHQMPLDAGMSGNQSSDKRILVQRLLGHTMEEIYNDSEGNSEILKDLRYVYNEHPQMKGRIQTMGSLLEKAQKTTEVENATEEVSFNLFASVFEQQYELAVESIKSARPDTYADAKSLQLPRVMN